MYTEWVHLNRREVLITLKPRVPTNASIIIHRFRQTNSCRRFWTKNVRCILWRRIAISWENVDQKEPINDSVCTITAASTIGQYVAIRHCVSSEGWASRIAVVHVVVISMKCALGPRRRTRSTMAGCSLLSVAIITGCVSLFWTRRTLSYKYDPVQSHLEKIYFRMGTCPR